MRSFFFFQAEDGIRDIGVTGVQTCALPISLLIPSAAAMMAPYSGPTTIAPTMRICELVRIPTAPISAAIASRPKKLGEYTAPPRMAASTISHTGAFSLAGEPMAVVAPVV